MTKAARIMELHAQGKSTRQIAVEVYGVPEDAAYAEWDKRMAYIRIVVRQRKGGKSGPADKRYDATPEGKAVRLGRVTRWQKRNPKKVQAWARARYRRNRLHNELRIS